MAKYQTAQDLYRLLCKNINKNFKPGHLTFSIKQCGIKMQVQCQQVYGQEKSGLDQPRPNNHKTKLCSFSLCNLLAGFPSVAPVVVHFEKMRPIYFASLYKWFLN